MVKSVLDHIWRTRFFPGMWFSQNHKNTSVQHVSGKKATSMDQFFEKAKKPNLEEFLGFSLKNENFTEKWHTNLLKEAVSQYLFYLKAGVQKWMEITALKKKKLKNQLTLYKVTEEFREIQLTGINIFFLSLDKLSGRNDVTSDNVNFWLDITQNFFFGKKVLHLDKYQTLVNTCLPVSKRSLVVFYGELSSPVSYILCICFEAATKA